MLKRIWNWLTWCDECERQRQRADFWRDACFRVAQAAREKPCWRCALDQEQERRRAALWIEELRADPKRSPQPVEKYGV